MHHLSNDVRHKRENSPPSSRLRPHSLHKVPKGPLKESRGKRRRVQLPRGSVSPVIFRIVCSVKKPAQDFPKNFALLRIAEKRASETPTPTGTPAPQSDECEVHKRKFELICYNHKMQICTSCALFGDHKNCDYRQQEEILNEITLRTELLLEIYELVEGTKANLAD